MDYSAFIAFVSQWLLAAAAATINRYKWKADIENGNETKKVEQHSLCDVMKRCCFDTFQPDTYLYFQYMLALESP